MQPQQKALCSVNRPAASSSAAAAARNPVFVGRATARYRSPPRQPPHARPPAHPDHSEIVPVIFTRVFERLLERTCAGRSRAPIVCSSGSGSRSSWIGAGARSSPGTARRHSRERDVLSGSLPRRSCRPADCAPPCRVWPYPARTAARECAHPASSTPWPQLPRAVRAPSSQIGRPRRPTVVVARTLRPSLRRAPLPSRAQLTRCPCVHPSRHSDGRAPSSSPFPVRRGAEHAKLRHVLAAAARRIQYEVLPSAPGPSRCGLLGGTINGGPTSCRHRRRGPTMRFACEEVVFPLERKQMTNSLRSLGRALRARSILGRAPTIRSETSRASFGRLSCVGPLACQAGRIRADRRVSLLAEETCGFGENGSIGVAARSTAATIHARRLGSDAPCSAAP